MGGGMEVHKNRWIEEWNAGRKNLELNFRWTRRSLAVISLFGLTVPLLVYKAYARRGRRLAVQEVPVMWMSSCQATIGEMESPFEAGNPRDYDYYEDAEVGDQGADEE